MASNFEKSVKGGTKIKLAPPKSKYVEHILIATHSGEAGVAEVFRTLQNRLRDSTWTVVFKALIIVHLMIKEGDKDVTLKYLAVAPKTRLAISQFTDVQTQGQNIRRYANYLQARAEGFADTMVDYVQPGVVDRMRTLSIEKGLLREVRSMQYQIRGLLKCDFFSTETENEIALMAYRLITKDLLELYTAMNQAVMNVLGRYFELSRVDAERAIAIYKVFTKQTDQVVQYLSIARQYEHVTRLEIPKIKHAPTSLVKALQEYLDDNDFDVNRRQYIAEQQAKGSGSKANAKGSEGPIAAPKPKHTSTTAEYKPPTTEKPQPAKGPAPDLIDFFDSIEQNQQPMAQQPAQGFQQPAAQGFQQPTGQGFQQGFAQQYPQTTGAPITTPQQTNPFMQQGAPQQQMQPQFTGVGFGGYGPQPQQQFVQPSVFQDASPQNMAQPMQQPVQQIPQQAFSPPQQPQQPPSTNPFRQSMMITGASTFPAAPQQQQPQSTNPFARSAQPQGQSMSAPQSQVTSPIQQGGSFSQQAQSSPFAAPQLQPQQTGTNPFARAQPAQQQVTGASPPPPLVPMVTGSTNPFRQSAFVHQQTGQGWQSAGVQGTLGGWEQLPTVPVFPRPGQPGQ